MVDEFGRPIKPSEIITSIENNVRVHFINYANRYINCCFNKEYDQLLRERERERNSVKRIDKYGKDYLHTKLLKN